MHRHFTEYAFPITGVALLPRTAIAPAERLPGLAQFGQQLCHWLTADRTSAQVFETDSRVFRFTGGDRIADDAHCQSLLVGIKGCGSHASMGVKTGDDQGINIFTDQACGKGGVAESTEKGFGNHRLARTRGNRGWGLRPGAAAHTGPKSVALPMRHAIGTIGINQGMSMEYRQAQIAKAGQQCVHRRQQLRRRRRESWPRQIVLLQIDK